MKIWMPTIRAGSGADVFTQRLAAGLEKAGHVPVVQWFEHRYEPVPWLLRKCAPPHGTDIVHSNSWQGFAFKRDGIPLVVTEHHYVEHPKFAPYRTVAQRIYHYWFIGQFMKRSYARAEAIVAVSSNTAAALTNDIQKDVQVVPNWLDMIEYAPAHSRMPRTSGPFKVLFVGNPSRRKGSDLLPTLASILGPEFELQCLGGLRSLITANNLPANMKLLDKREAGQMPQLYRDVDAVVVLARYEAFGYVALEAMASGLPVVGFDSTGTAEICVHESTALLSPVDDIQAIAANLRRLASDSELYARLAMTAVQRAKANFDEPAGIRRYLEIYQDCLRNRV